jgi:hypothetical protein
VTKKSEARIARKLERQLRHEQKSARLRATVTIPEAAPRAGADPGSIYHTVMTWTDEHADRTDQWSWGQQRDWGPEVWTTVIEPKLKQWVLLRWSEIERFTTDNGHRMHHSMSTETICNEGQERLIEIDLYVDELYRFRLGNKRRLWGRRIVSEFQIVWYDPEHRIYPTDPD